MTITHVLLFFVLAMVNQFCPSFGALTIGITANLVSTVFPWGLTSFFPNSVSLGSSAIVKVPEQVRFPSKVPKNRLLMLPGTAAQEQLPKQDLEEQLQSR